MTLSPIRTLSASEVTRELLALCLEAGQTERRMMLVFIRGDDGGVKDHSEALARLYDLIGGAPDKARRMTLYFARRLIVAGQRVYGVLDLRTDRRQFSVEGLEEDADGAVYRMAADMAGRPDGFLTERLESFRESLAQAVAKELV